MNVGTGKVEIFNMSKIMRKHVFMLYVNNKGLSKHSLLGGQLAQLEEPCTSKTLSCKPLSALVRPARVNLFGHVC